RAMSKRAGSTVVEVKGSHALYVSQPQASLISSKRPQRVHCWQGKKRPEGVYWPQNSQRIAGFDQAEGFRGRRTHRGSLRLAGESEKEIRGFMKTLVVGAGALGGIIGARLLRPGRGRGAGENEANGMVSSLAQRS